MCTHTYTTTTTTTTNDDNNDNTHDNIWYVVTPRCAGEEGEERTEQHVYTYVYICIYVYMCIYIYRERERAIHTCILYIYI